VAKEATNDLTSLAWTLLHLDNYFEEMWRRRCHFPHHQGWQMQSWNVNRRLSIIFAAMEILYQTIPPVKPGNHAARSSKLLRLKRETKKESGLWQLYTVL
jgi:hypothetical protein